MITIQGPGRTSLRRTPAAACKTRSREPKARMTCVWTKSTPSQSATGERHSPR